jgi:hypothetical protein
VQVPVPLVISTVAPLIEQAPLAAKVTGNPELAEALTVNVLPYTADAGRMPKLIVWFAFVTVNVVLESLAAPNMESPAKLYVIG